MEKGTDKGNRTDTWARAIFSHEMRFDVSDGTVPILTTKKVFYRGIIHELIWFLSGSTNIQYLLDNEVHIWNEWADENGELGPLYGAQWRNWNGNVDQIQDVINLLLHNPQSRRIIVNAWNPEVLPDESYSPQFNVTNGKQALAPCHCMFQFYTAGDELSLKLTQRSCDIFLGVPFNIAQYAILLHVMAKLTGFKPKEFIWSGGDIHIYNNHFDVVEEQLSRDVEKFDAPTIKIGNFENIDSLRFEDITIENYNSYEALKGKVAV